MIPLAHSARDGKLPQSYREHVTGVVDRACSNLKAMLPYIGTDRSDCYLEIVKGAATYHDLGKLAVQNQDVLIGKTKSVHLTIEHRDAGVKHLIGCNAEQPSATLVYAHHCPGLPNLMEQKTQIVPISFFRSNG